MESLLICQVPPGAIVGNGQSALAKRKRGGNEATWGVPSREGPPQRRQWVWDMWTIKLVPFKNLEDTWRIIPVSNS